MTQYRYNTGYTEIDYPAFSILNSGLQLMTMGGHVSNNESQAIQSSHQDTVSTTVIVE